MKKAANRVGLHYRLISECILSRAKRFLVEHPRCAGLPKSGEHKFKKWLFVVQRRSA